MTYLIKPPVYNTANGVTLNAGTSSDAVGDLQTLIDGNTYNLTEANATPGQDLEVDFTNVTRIKHLLVHAYYLGLATHGVRIQLYNYDDTAWDTIHTLSSGQDYQMLVLPIPVDTDYISGSAAIIRFYHTEAGNNTHNLYVDYAALGF